MAEATERSELAPIRSESEQSSLLLVLGLRILALGFIGFLVYGFTVFRFRIKTHGFGPRA